MSGRPAIGKPAIGKLARDDPPWHSFAAEIRITPVPT